MVIELTDVQRLLDSPARGLGPNNGS